MIRVTKRLLACGFLLVAAACAGPSNDQFASMANAGKAFTAQVPAVYQYAYNQALKDSTAEFQKNHAKALSLSTPSARQTVLQSLGSDLSNDNKALIQRQALFDAMVRQSDLLNRYFTQVSLLAGGGEADKAGAAANEAAKALSSYVSELSMPIGSGGKTVDQVFGSVTSLVVGQVSNKALQENLTAHGKSVLGAIRVQSEMLAQLQKDALDAREAALGAELKSALLQDKALPSNWAQTRVELLARKPELNPISTTLKASRELETTFRALSAGGAGGVDELNRAIVITETLINAFGG